MSSRTALLVAKDMKNPVSGPFEIAQAIRNTFENLDFVVASLGEAIGKSRIKSIANGIKIGSKGFSTGVELYEM